MTISTAGFTRQYRHVDRFAAGDKIRRADADVWLDDFAEGLNEALKRGLMRYATRADATAALASNPGLSEDQSVLIRSDESNGNVPTLNIVAAGALVIDVIFSNVAGPFGRFYDDRSAFLAARSGNAGPDDDDYVVLLSDSALDDQLVIGTALDVENENFAPGSGLGGAAAGVDDVARAAAAAAQAKADQNESDIANLGAVNGGIDQTARDALVLRTKPYPTYALADAGVDAVGQKLFVEADEVNGNGNPALYTRTSVSALTLNRVLATLADITALDGRVATLESAGGTAVDQTARDAAATAQGTANNAETIAQDNDDRITGVNTQLNSLDQRVTSIESNGGGGGGTVDQTARDAAQVAQDTASAAQQASAANDLDIGALNNRLEQVEKNAQTFATRSEYTAAVNTGLGPDSNQVVIIRSDSDYSGATMIGTGAQFAANSGLTDISSGGGGGGGTVDQTARDLATSAQNTADNNEIAIAAIQASASSFRTFESFGNVTSVDHQSGATTLAQRQNNDAALISARNWCRDTGGIVTFLGRKYAFDATFTGHSYTNFMGSGWNQTHLVWPTGQHAIECQSASGDSSYGITLSHLQIGNETWNHNQSEANASQYSAINITGRGSGPNDAEAYAREGVGYLSDPYHRFFFVCVQEFDGNGFSLAGRGEIDITHCIARRTSGYGIDTTAPDLWLTHNTVSETGLSGLRMNSGNVTLANNKFWFNGKLKQETVGAGMEFTGSGKGNVTSTNDRIQDTWGPGLQVAGSHFNFVGLNITEPAGGRVESQGDGFEGTRGQPRCAIRFENAKNCRIQGTVQNQNYQGSGSGDYPYLVYHADSGGRGNMVDLACELGDNWRDTLEVAGWTNADRWSRVIYNGDELLGQVPLSALNDPTHGINESGGKYGPGAGVNVSDGANSGYAFRDGGTWQFMQRTASYTP